MLPWTDKKTGRDGRRVPEIQKILPREQKEFREEMEREVSVSLPFHLVKEKQDLKGM